MIDDQLVPALLQADEFEHRSRDDERARDEVGHDLIGDLLSRQIVRVSILGDRQTGVSMNRLVSG